MEIEGDLVLLIFEDKHFYNYKGKKGLYQIIGELVGAALHNDRETESKRKTWNLFGVRLSSEDVTFYSCNLVQSQLEALRGGFLPDAIEVRYYHGENAIGRHGLSLVDPEERSEVLQNLMNIKHFLEETYIGEPEEGKDEEEEE